jgi:hypothetical protein
MKINIGNQAVSEIVGTILLLSIAIGLFSIVQIMVFAIPFNPGAPSARLVASINGSTVYVVHHGGESLSLDTKVVFTVGDNTFTKNASEILNQSTSDGDDLWSIGEMVNYTRTEFELARVYVTVVDIKSNSVVMMGAVREGS